uniref:Uncharacterized protein n=1 Tax=Trichobilharzia regenti TaxID=157069 RepID=A0AA85J6S7_TRIRE|nr:unnamed protein product [Trichobilharzia regenti]
MEKSIAIVSRRCGAVRQRIVVLGWHLSVHHDSLGEIREIILISGERADIFSLSESSKIVNHPLNAFDAVPYLFHSIFLALMMYYFCMVHLLVPILYQVCVQTIVI